MSFSFLIQFVLNVISSAPVWVWPLLVVLIYAGIRASKTRSSPTIPFYFAPLLGLITLQSIYALPHPNAVWFSFAASYCIATVLFFKIQGRWILERANGRVRLAGEWLSFTTFMLIFWANFVLGMVKAVDPDFTERSASWSHSHSSSERWQGAF